MIEIKVLVQVTLDGYIARADGKRDWYLNPDRYGITDFFDKATAIFNYENGKFRTEYEGGPDFLDDTLTAALKRVNGIKGYIAVEAIPQTLQLVDELMSSNRLTEVHYIQIPVILGHGIRCPRLYKSIDGPPIKTRNIQDGIFYSVYRIVTDSTEKKS